MGSRMSVNGIEHQGKKESQIGKKRTKKQRESHLLRCCKSPNLSDDIICLSETPISDKNKIKKSKKCLYENLMPSISCQQSYANFKKSGQIKWRQSAGKGSFLAAFFKIFDDDIIQDFLWMDQCFILADNYLLAMIYTYFRRANLHRREYNRTNFFAALYLAHDMEEDNEDLKLEIYPWALGDNWREYFDEFIDQKDGLLKRMEYRAAVSKQTADEVMALCPKHPIWKRVRKGHHGGAERIYPDEEDSEIELRGRNRSPPSTCSLCFALSDENQTSSTITSGYLSEMTLLSPPPTILDVFSEDAKSYCVETKARRNIAVTDCFLLEE